MAKVWIDFDNAPHVHLFAPIIADLRQRGVESLLTVRSFGQTEGLARAYGMDFTVIGEHRTPHSTLARVSATLQRAAQLAAFARGHRPTLAVSHGSRSLTIGAYMIGVPSVALYDYEFVSTGIFYRLSRRVMVPEVVARNGSVHATGASKKLVGYPGLKEEAYVYDVRPTPEVLSELHLDRSRTIITVRPPATWAHYHNHHSVVLFRALLERLRQETGAQVLVLARDREQAAQLTAEYSLEAAPFRVLHNAVDGLSLMYYSDAVFSGGGTMVREAALLGVDAYSTFAGTPGAADAELERQGKLKLLRTPEEIQAISLRKRSLERGATRGTAPTRAFIVNHILELIADKQ